MSLQLSSVQIEVVRTIRRVYGELRFSYPDVNVLCGQALQESSLRPAVANMADKGGGSAGLFMFAEPAWNECRQAMANEINWRGLHLDIGNWPEGCLDGEYGAIHSTQAVIMRWRMLREQLCNEWGITFEAVENWHILAAYNAGMGYLLEHVNREMLYDDAQAHLPVSTHGYILNILGYSQEMAFIQ